ncbi:hypothetical protein DNH61_20175 [Paenibacillus sambharensis]|uniref:YgiT-type zinc finger protein n=2 Tax=Paenibacillus sambharensis TaxID=1803190 RepID=A0A2W1LFJ2_9BACL|nr:hypothetical protein [Paenibacillus sambharensis]PZD93825.1 hypothetical protein DNH61_20175 [Paenibacillus sambharensis]
MQKMCPCGNDMQIRLRTVIYSGKVEIDNVPIYSCSACSRNEVFPEVKPDLTGLIGQLGTKPAKQTFLFNEWNEWADVLMEACMETKHPAPAEVSRLLTERVDALLDMYLLAQTLKDYAWKEEIRRRLSQISVKLPIT